MPVNWFWLFFLLCFTMLPLALALFKQKLFFFFCGFVSDSWGH